MPPKDKPHMNLIVIGHVDHGKSTMMGHVLVVTGAVSDREARELEQLAKDLDRESWKFAYFMDRLAEERKRGLTIDLAFKRFETENRYFTIIDAPGHADFIKNMITGASQADAAILVVSAKTGEFEAGIAEGGQTREHAFLARTLGVGQIIVAVNKMDDKVVGWSKERYEEVREEVSKLLKTVGYRNVDEIPFVPISGYLGDNLASKSENMSWYDGPTLVQALDALQIPEKPTGKPLRIPVQDVYKIKGAGVVPVGKVETGVLKVKDTVLVQPSGFKGEVRSIEMHHESIETAEPGDNIGFNIRGATMKDLKRGYVVCHPDNPATVVTPKGYFQGQIIVVWHPRAVAQGYCPVVHAHTAQVACKFIELVKKVNPADGSIIEDSPQMFRTNESGIVKLQPITKMCVEKFKEFPEIGRFAVRDMGRTVAVGIVLDVEPGA
ncbi:MAG: translation elongation factor EF-1 subunit alpha [Promethearchaeota archaeon]